MTDDDNSSRPTLTRRRILAGIGTVGAASAAAGAGTMAYFSDTESSSGNTVSAGTLNLKADGNDGTATTTINVDDVAPGESGGGSTTLKNAGSLSGYLNFDIGSLTNHENTVIEPEEGAPGETAGSGELGRAHEAAGAHALDIRAGFDTTGNGDIDTVVLNSMNKDPRNNISGVTGIEYNPNESISSEGQVDFVVEYELPSNAGNAVQGDSVEFPITFELLQHASGSSIAITGDSLWSQSSWELTTDAAHVGNGSWLAKANPDTPDNDYGSEDGDNVQKRNLYFAGEFSSFHDLPNFTVDEIEDISYWVKSPSLSNAGIYLTIYTKPENDGEDASWYDSRLQALPNDATDSSGFQDGAWNEFGTSSNAQHQLTFYDHVPSFPKPSADNQPTLADLQGGDFDWDTTDSDGTDDYTPQSYHDEEVLALALSTGSTNTDIDAYLDDITLELTSGETFTIDLEP